MIQKIFFHLLMITIFSCSGGASKPDPREGIYVRGAQSAFSRASDTLIIRPYDARAGIYNVLHHIGYQRFKDNVWQEKEYQRDSSLAFMEKGSGQLREQKLGRVYIFSSTGKEVFLKAARYQKID